MKISSYLSMNELSLYFERVKESSPCEYIAANLMIYGGFTLAECCRLAPRDVLGDAIMNERLKRILVFSEPFKLYVNNYVCALPSGADILFYGLSSGKTPLEKYLGTHIRRNLSAIGVEGGPSMFTATFYIRYLSNCGSFDRFEQKYFQRQGWLESNVGIDKEMYGQCKSEFCNSILPSDFIDLCDAFLSLAVNNPILNEKCHEIYAAMYDCISTMSNSSPKY